MKTIEEILAAQQALVDAAKGENRNMTDDEATMYEALETELRATTRTQEIEKRQAAYMAPNASVSVAAVVNVGAKTDNDEYRAAFDRFIRDPKDAGLAAELRAQSVGTPAAGGYTVPETMLTKITERLKAFGGVATEVETISTSTGEALKWPTLDDTANTGVIKAEGAAPASGGADLVFGEKTLGAFLYTAPGAGQLPLRVSTELLQDSAFDIQGLIVRKLTERIAREQSADWVNGTGTTKPFGIATGTKVAAGTFTTAAPTYASLLAALHQVDPAYRDSAVWTLSDATMALIEGLTDSTGRPLLNAHNDGINVGRTNATLLGFPVRIDQAWATYADNTENAWGAFGNLNAGYIIRRVANVDLIVNPYTRANEGQVEFTLRMRADGTVQDPHAYRVLVNEEN